MAVSRCAWTVGLLLLVSFLVTSSFPGSVNGLEGKATNERKSESKVKCRQHIEEALRQYWDHEKGEYVPITDNDERASSQEEASSTPQPDEESTEDSAEQPEAATAGDNSAEQASEHESDETSSEEQVGDGAQQQATSAEDDATQGSSEDNSTENASQETVGPLEESGEEEPSAELDAASSEEEETSPVDADGSATSSEADQADEAGKAVSAEESEPDASSEENASAESAPQEEATASAETQDEAPSAESDESVEDATVEPEPEPVVEPEPEPEEEVGPFRSRSQIEDVLRLYEIGTKEDRAEQQLILSIFRDLKRIYETSIKPMEQLYKYRDITTRLITDSEIFSKPMVMFMGAKSSGKTSLVNYLLGLESTPLQLKTGLSVGSPHFTILEHGETFSQLTPSEVSADFAFSNLQQFGQRFVQEHLQASRMPLSILQRITIVDSPGLIEGILNKTPEPGKAIDNEVYQWFVDRSDIIYIVIDISQVYLTQSLQALLEQLKGRDVRFIITKSDMVSQTQCIMLIGQLLWMLSPIMPSDRPPQVHALTTSPSEVYNAFLDAQEQEWLADLSEQISGIARIESRVAAVRRHAVRVRNHAKLVDCYLATYYKKKGYFTWGAAAKKIALEITENPHQYSIFSGAVVSQLQNISRYDLPDPNVYREFFRVNPLSDFSPLSATCSFLKGCPIDKLDVAIAYQLPELVGKYKKLTRVAPGKK